MIDNVTMVIDDKEIQKYMSLILRRIGSLKGFFVSIIPIIHGSIVANFREQGRPTKWQALETTTIEGRIRKKTWPGFGGASPILQEEGTLKRSIGSVREIGVFELEYGTNLEKAQWLQHGTKNMPARPFVLFQPEDIRSITSLAAAFAFDTRTGIRLTKQAIANN